MNSLINFIQEKLVINKDSTLKTQFRLDSKNIELIRKVINFYVECFLSQDTVDKISEQNKIDDDRYFEILSHINNIIEHSTTQPKAVDAILFNNEFKDKDEVNKITDLFINLENETSIVIKDKLKKEILNIINIYK